MNLEQKIIKLRKELPHVLEGECVIAKWPQNGWYYQSFISKYLGDYKYRIKAVSGQKTEVYREDILPLSMTDIHSFEVCSK